MTKLLKFLHLIPFTHFYSTWSDTKDCMGYGGNERQKRHCVVCNKKQYRTVKNYFGEF
jgi:hypothetical protein